LIEKLIHGPSLLIMLTPIIGEIEVGYNLLVGAISTAIVGPTAKVKT
jgi:hypothetical protein